MSSQNKLDRAKIALIQRPDAIFLATILFSLRTRFDNTIPSACTNGIQLRINEDWFMSLDAEERVGLLAHEAMHVALQHMSRLQTRNHRLWNMAADYVINNHLVAEHFTLPKGGLVDPKYSGMSSEEVYELLKQDAPEGPSNLMLDLEEATDEDGTPMDAEALKTHLDGILVKAATQAKMAQNKPGSIPGEVQIYLDKLLNPKLPWNQLLQNFMTATVHEDYSWRRPNRRFMPDHYLPSLHSEGLQEIAVAVDASGSVRDEEFLAFVSEIHAIQKRLQPKKITVISFDHGIRNVHELHSVDDITDLSFTGRGGTDISPVLDWAKTHKPNALLIFTDGEFYTDDNDPKVPVMWVIHSNPRFSYPFGRVIEYPM